MAMFRKPLAATVALSLIVSQLAIAQKQGPSTLSTPYVLPTQAGVETTSVLTVDNTGTIADDTVPNLVGGAPYALSGIPDGEGAFDNGNGTFTLVVNHEIVSGGATRAHGSTGAYVSKWIIQKNTLAVLGGEDLMKQIFEWNATTQQSNTNPTTTAFTRFCSADLPEVTAFFNPATGLGTRERIFMHGEEAGAGRNVASVVTGPDAGKSYVLGKFNLNTNGSGINANGSWENTLASPFPQDKTVVIANSDGGSGIHNNAVAVYVGTKQSSGSEADKAGLTNGTLKFVNVPGNPTEISNSTTRDTNIANGMRFTLNATTSTAFSRPEDGAWNPLNPRQYFFVTTDQLDTVNDGLGNAIGVTRLWRLTFDDITNPDLGGIIDALIAGQIVDGIKVNMFDNITVQRSSGRILLQEDVGGAAHNGKIWEYDPATFNGTTNSGSLKMIAKHDPARFGDRLGGVTTAATLPFNNDEETSGIIDITDIMRSSSLHIGNPRETWYISSDQAHYTTGITSSQVEGGQIFVVHELAPENNVQVTRTGYVRDRRTGTYSQMITLTNNNATTLPGPIYLVLDGLASNGTLTSQTGVTTVYDPQGSPYIQVSGSALAAGASLTVTLQFSNPSGAALSWTDRVLNSITLP